MTISCDRCGKEIGEDEPRYMYTKTVGRDRGPFGGGGQFQKEVPLCEDCWQESAGRRQSFLDALLATIARGPH